VKTLCFLRSRLLRLRLSSLFIFCVFCSLCVELCAQGPPNDPVADPKAVVVEGHRRITFLTPHIVRLEWAEDGKFEDRASMVFVNRKTPPPQQVVRGLTNLELKAGASRKYTALPWNLQVSFPQADTGTDVSVTCGVDGKQITWHPGLENSGNLGGTIRTLDGAKGEVPLDPGLLSRDGWTFIDDSNTPVFDNSDWPWVEAREQGVAPQAASIGTARPAGKRIDWYLLCYGHDYKGLLKDFTEVAGKIPLPPLFAFGTWWSRYWAYSDQEFEDLVRQFHSHDVPLDVLVVDMDWHPTFGVKWWENKKDQSGHTLGWTGYTWNRTLFPDPEGFLKWVHDQGLKVPLNLHPASGVQPHEDAYPEMARAMGIDPATKKYVPFDIASKKFAENYFNILHHPLEKQGVDFWWLDWQQEDKTSLPGVNPTWWLNYAHFTDFERRGKRGMIFHRWGGLGNHRYQIGFSGDTFNVWDSLAFQPYFTATAANVLYGYWSHDIGGHMPGIDPPELYTRWIQWGVFSPILRTHTTKNPDSERRIWAFPAEYASTMRDAFILRYALIPYIYTAARESYDTGVAMLRPMYYQYPDAPEAYDARDQYMFGDDMIVAPVTAAADLDTELAGQSVWLPQGEWIEWQTGARLKGGQRYVRNYSLSQIPVFVRAGAIIPMEPKMSHTGEKPVDPLILEALPGMKDEARIYADEGAGLGYKDKAFTWTTVRQQRDAHSIHIEILPVQGSYPGMLTERGYEIRLPGTWPPQRVTVNGAAVPKQMGAPGWRYDGNSAMTIVLLPRTAVSKAVKVDIEVADDLTSPQLDGVAGKIKRLMETTTILEHTWPQGWAPDVLLEASQTGDRLTFKPETAASELGTLDAKIAQAMKEIEAMRPDAKIGEIAKTAAAHLRDAVQ